jgi:hypothetical protein
LKFCTNSMRVTARSAQQHFWRPWYKFLKVSDVVFFLHKATIELTFFPFRISADRSGIAHRRRAACANCKKKISKGKSPCIFTTQSHYRDYFSSSSSSTLCTPAGGPKVYYFDAVLVTLHQHHILRFEVAVYHVYFRPPQHL